MLYGEPKTLEMQERGIELEGLAAAHLRQVEAGYVFPKTTSTMMIYTSCGQQHHIDMLYKTLSTKFSNLEEVLPAMNPGWNSCKNIGQEETNGLFRTGCILQLSAFKHRRFIKPRRAERGRKIE